MAVTMARINKSRLKKQDKNQAKACTYRKSSSIITQKIVYRRKIRNKK